MPRAAPNRLRIIAGEWRGRKVPFADAEGLRPTPDRVRETLFNWLAPVIEGARCLDLFAGSGALGLEALSRGAADVVMLDRHPQVIKQLQANLALLATERATAIHSEALNYLQHSPPRRFDVVFLDPPYRQDLLAPCCALLAQRGWLAEAARVYLEIESEHELPPLPTGWQLVRSKKAGQVAYHLAIVSGKSLDLS